MTSKTLSKLGQFLYEQGYSLENLIHFKRTGECRLYDKEELEEFFSTHSISTEELEALLEKQKEVEKKIKENVSKAKKLVDECESLADESCLSFRLNFACESSYFPGENCGWDTSSSHC